MFMGQPFGQKMSDLASKGKNKAKGQVNSETAAEVGEEEESGFMGQPSFKKCHISLAQAQAQAKSIQKLQPLWTCNLHAAVLRAFRQVQRQQRRTTAVLRRR